MMFGDKILGIDIGSKNIKVALLKRGREFEISDLAIDQTPKDCIVDGEIKDSDIIAARIKNILANHKIKPKKLAMCVNSPFAVLRQISLPLLKDNEIMNAVEFDLSQTFPGVSQSHSISFKEHSRNNESINGVVAFCPNNILAEYTNIAKKIGIPLKYIDITGNCAAKTYRKFVNTAVNDDTSVLLVDIGHTQSQVCVIKGGRAIQSRSVACGGGLIDSLISNRLNLSTEQAEIKKIKGLRDRSIEFEDVESYSRIGYSPVEEQIKQTMDYYAYNKLKSNIGSIVLMGQGSLFQGYSLYLSETFNLPVTRIRQKLIDLKFKDLFADCVLAIGAAIRED